MIMGATKMNDVMNNESNVSVEDNQDQLDAQFMDELERFNSTLSVPSAESVSRYEANMRFLFDIHDEIRKVNHNFRPIYVPEASVEIPKDKYVDFYTLGTF